jgi:hypothetical protein
MVAALRRRSRLREQKFEKARAARQWKQGTNSAVAIYRGDRPSFPPSPRAWPVILGAADMPIGCALTFLTG